MGTQLDRVVSRCRPPERTASGGSFRCTVAGKVQQVDQRDEPAGPLATKVPLTARPGAGAPLHPAMLHRLARSHPAVDPAAGVRRGRSSSAGLQTSDGDQTLRAQLGDGSTMDVAMLLASTW